MTKYYLLISRDGPGFSNYILSGATAGPTEGYMGVTLPTVDSFKLYEALDAGGIPEPTYRGAIGTVASRGYPSFIEIDLKTALAIGVVARLNTSE